jgi:hypothetical protein
MDMASAEAEDYRFPREPGTTKDGYPLPLSGEMEKPLSSILVTGPTGISTAWEYIPPNWSKKQKDRDQ